MKTCTKVNIKAIVALITIFLILGLSTSSGNTPNTIIICELLADNTSTLPLEFGEILDGNGDASDWIEIHNQSKRVIDISGWYLTDDIDQKTKWQFPAGMEQLNLQPGEYLLVFASGKTEAQNTENFPYLDSAGYLHTNFKLSKDGEYLGLIHGDGITTIHAYDQVDLGDEEFGYPEQKENVSYGYFQNQPQYFQRPTPGSANSEANTGCVDKPIVSMSGGCYEHPLHITMQCDTNGALIRYTLDGSVPNQENGIDYVDGKRIYIDRSTTLIARAFKPGLAHSQIVSETYIFLSPNAAVVNSNLPIVVIDTFGSPIPNDKVNKTPARCQAVIIDTHESLGRAFITHPQHFQGLGQIRYRGESTYGTRRHFAFEVQDIEGQDKDVPLLGMPAESDWVISSDQLDATLLKSEIAFKWFRDMGHYAPRQRYIEMYINEDRGPITTDDYRGIFVLREKIKRSKNRVDIDNLDPSDNQEPQISGGYILKNDKVNTGDILLKDHMEKAYYNIHWTGGGKAIIADPRPDEITTSQIEWITHYLNEFHSVLWYNTTSHYYPGPMAHYTDYLDVTSWIDHGIVEQTCADSDAFWGSYFTHKDREGKICSGPPWDFDRAFHNNGGSLSGYNKWKRNSALFGKWHQKLQEHPEYALLLADRWFAHRRATMGRKSTMKHIDETVALISEAMDRSIQKHGFRGIRKNYPDEIDLFKEWITHRLQWMDTEIANRFASPPPILSLPGGQTRTGTALYLQNPPPSPGTIYYTLNGEDPRMEGGRIHPSAQQYHPVELPEEIPFESLFNMSSVIWKYSFNGSNQGIAWRSDQFDDSSWKSGRGQLGFGEGDERTDIRPRPNVSDYPTAYFRHRFDLLHPETISALRIRLLHDDGAVVYINSHEVGRVHMPQGTIHYDTLASESGENTISIIDEIPLSILRPGKNTLAVEVHQRGYSRTDLSFALGLEYAGPSNKPVDAQIVLNKSTKIKSRIKDRDTWSAINEACFAVGPIVENLRITEIMYHPVEPKAEFIELQNIGNQTINLNLVRFTDGIDFTFGDVILAPGAYAVLVKDREAFAAQYDTTGINIIPGNFQGSLNNSGEEIVLRDAIGVEILDFDYNDNWFEETDGRGHSLVKINPSTALPEDWDLKSGWKQSLNFGGTPGRAN